MIIDSDSISNYIAIVDGKIEFIQAKSYCGFICPLCKSIGDILENCEYIGYETMNKFHVKCLLKRNIEAMYKDGPFVPHEILIMSDIDLENANNWTIIEPPKIEPPELKQTSFFSGPFAKFFEDEAKKLLLPSGYWFANYYYPGFG